ncbi:MAG: LD-carboxypeptidase, partial [Paludibacteraceae bacterium]|nr:LD-carboxypeptidase [Paludibacteraceae bacterium]
QRISDLNEAFADPKVDAILCARGGYGLQRILDRIRPTPKLVIGFSDITALHQLMHSIGVPSLHAIMCKHIATLPEESEALQSFRKALQECRVESVECRVVESVECRVESLEVKKHPLNRPGIARGTLIGGNLSVLYGLQGTPYGLTNPSILFIEDIAERHYHIDRMMQNLRLSGVLANLSGLIVGQFTDCEQDPGMHETIEETILRAVADYDYPVAFNFPAGHVEKNLPLWLGREVELEVTPSITRITYARE